jgi:hypothetical protein
MQDAVRGGADATGGGTSATRAGLASGRGREGGVQLAIVRRRGSAHRGPRDEESMVKMHS